MQRCRKCGAYSNYAKIRFDHMGICNYCVFYEKHKNILEQKTALEKTFLLKMEIGKTKAKEAGSQYDCLAAFSGGKRSTYMICQLKEVYNMRVLAFTFDDGSSTKYGREHLKNVLEKLHVDHITFSIDHRKLEKTGIDLFSAYIHYINYYSYLLAGQNKIPLILNGRSKEKILQYTDTTSGTEPFETAHNFREFEKQIFQQMGAECPIDTLDETDLLDDIGAEAISYFAYHDISKKDMVRSLEERIGWIHPQKSCSRTRAMAERMYIEKNGSPSKRGELAFLVRKGELTPDAAEKILQKSLEKLKR